MDAPHGFLVTFAMVLCAAAVTTVVFERLKQPVVLGYLLAGLLVGPHLTLVPMVADLETTEVIAELGVILLLFAIGLEFSIRRLLRVGGAATVTAILDVSLMAWLGFSAGRLLGFDTTEALFTGAITAISSTTIIAKTFEDVPVTRRLRDLVFGVLIVEDLAAVLFLAGLATLAGGGDGRPLVETGLRLVTLLGVWVTAGLLVIPRLMRFVVRLGRPETTLVASLGLCFAFALLALRLGYSVALGAFIAGSLIAESGKSHAVMTVVRPVRDVFAAVFFVAVGMLIDPALLVEHWPKVVVLTLVVVGGKILSVSSGAFLAGQGTRIAMRAGMSMAQIGEFSFIIAALGLSLGATGEFLYPVAVAVSAITTLMTPYLVRSSDGVAATVDRKLPRPLQTVVTLYGTWVDTLTTAPRRGERTDRIRRMVRWLLLDAVVIALLLIGAGRNATAIGAWLVDVLGVPMAMGRVAVGLTTAVVLTPFLLGVVRLARGLSQQLAALALPHEGRLDLAHAPRRMLVAALQLGLVALVGLPVLAVTQPFLPSYPVVVVLVGVLGVLAILAWRSATDLEGHVQAGSELLLSALRGSLPPEQATSEHPVQATPSDAALRLETATHLLPGIGKPRRWTIEAGHHAVGRTLGEVGLRGRTGATVLAITRAERGIPAPSKLERLEVGDQLVLVGSEAAIDAAVQILAEG